MAGERATGLNHKAVFRCGMDGLAPLTYEIPATTNYICVVSRIMQAHSLFGVREMGLAGQKLQDFSHPNGRSPQR